MERAEALNLRARPLSFVSAQPAEDICSVAGVKRASLVLLGWHKPLISRNALGGTVREVMGAAPADVGVLVDRGLTRIQRVLVPYLGSPHDHAALLLAQRLYQRGASLTVLHVVRSDQSDGRALMRLSGSRVRDLLAKGCPIDLHPRAFKGGDVALTTISHIGVHLWQVDDAPTYDLALMRSMAESFWSWLDASAAEFGYSVA